MRRPRRTSLSQRLLGTRLPPVLPAFVAGFLAAAVTGQLGAFPSTFALPGLELIRPEFSWTAIATVTPVLLALMTVQSNVPSVIYLRSQGFRPPERILNLVSGAGTLLGRSSGRSGLARPAPRPGHRRTDRGRSFAPLPLDLSARRGRPAHRDLRRHGGRSRGARSPGAPADDGGSALVPALAVALREISAGPLVLGPLFAFAIALSNMTVFGLGSFFWSLVLGTAISLLLERDGWKRFRAGALDEGDA